MFFVFTSIIILSVSPALAMTDSDKVSNIYEKLGARVQHEKHLYSKEEIIELEQGISDCNMILESLKQSSFLKPTQEYTEAIILSSKQCTIQKPHC